MGQDRQPPAGDDSETSEPRGSSEFPEEPFTVTVRGHAPFSPETTPPLIAREPRDGSVPDDGWSRPRFPSTPAGLPRAVEDILREAAEPDAETARSEGEAGATEPSADELAAEAERQREQQRRRTRTIIRELTETGLLALIVFLAVRASFQNFKVDGNSMFPTLHNGQFLIVNKLVYAEVDVKGLSRFLPFIDPGTSPRRNLFHGPQRGDIVVLVDPQRASTDLVKRIIGLPGESVEIVDGRVYINGNLLVEPYIKAAWHDTKPKVEIPAGQYFVMGDNRDNSLDSRSAQVGLIPLDHIIGKALLSYWPSDRFGLAPNEAPTLSTQDTVPAASPR